MYFFTENIANAKAVRLKSKISSGLRFFCGVVIFAVVGLTGLVTIAQERTNTDAARKDSTNPDKTFLPAQNMLEKPISSGGTKSTTGTMTKDPMLAVALSLIPGLGQIYVESYWKAPIFLAGFGTAVGFTIYNSQQYAIWDSILAVRDTNRTIGFTSIITRQREIFRDLRDISIVAGIGVIGLAAIDAYVGAHLFDFDVSDEFKASLRINPLQGRINLTLRRNDEAETQTQLRIINDETRASKTLSTE